MAVVGSSGVALALVVVFGLGVVSKARELRNRTAAWHPMFLGAPWRRAHAPALVATGIVADAMTIALLVLDATIGSILAAVVLAGYAALYVAWVDDRGDGCRCLAGLLDARDARGVVTRNGLLAAAALLLGGVAPQLSPTSVGVGVLVLATPIVVVRVIEMGTGGGLRANQ